MLQLVKAQPIEERDSLLIVPYEEEEDSGDDEHDYGNTLEFDQRSANQRAAVIRAIYGKKVCNMLYDELFGVDCVFNELLMAAEVPFREEFLDCRAEAYPMIQQYRKLDHATICRMVIDVNYFLRHRAHELLEQLGEEEFIRSTAALDARRSEQRKVRERLVAEFRARPVPKVAGCCLLSNPLSWITPRGKNTKTL